nr:cadherin-like domain-containing protein [Chitinophagales bacterium]
MQKILFLWCFCLLSTNTFAQFTSAQQVIDQLIGNWPWAMAQGGFAGETITPVSSGIAANYQITQDPTDIGEDSLTVQLYTYTTLITENKVKVVPWNTDGWAISGADLSGGIFGGGSTFYPIITLNDINLTLNDNIGDGYTYYFGYVDLPTLDIVATTTATTTCNACDGTIDITIDGGTAPYAYIWNNLNTTEDQTNLCTSIYALTVTDAYGITATQSVNVSCSTCVNPPFVALTGGAANLCNSIAEGNTTLDLNTLLGTSTVGGIWSGVGVSGNTFNTAGLAVGSYVVTYTIAATDNCPAASGTRALYVLDCDPTPIAIPDFMPVELGTALVTVNVLNNDTDNGFITVINATVDPANGTVTINGNSGVNYIPSGSATGAVEITYTIQDNVGQTATSTLTVLFSDCLAYAGDINLMTDFIDEDNLPVYCSDAIINLSQTAPFNNDANFTQAYLVTDTLGNIAQIHNTLPIPAPSAGIWKIAALNYKNGDLIGLAIGENVNDLNGCYAINYTDNFLMLSPIEITYTIEYVNTNQIVHFQIYGNSDYYFIDWPPFYPIFDPNLGYAPFDVTLPCDAVIPFDFTVHGHTGLCNGFVTVNPVPNCPNFFLTSTTTPTTTCGACDGTIDIALNGGTAPYAYIWNNLNTTEDQTNLCAGTYTLTVTDADGNTATVSTIVNGAITITLGNYACLNEITALTSITMNGGVPPYTVSSTGIYDAVVGDPFDFVDYTTNANSIEFVTHEGQPWSFTVVDANGCTSTKTGAFDLPNPSLNPISAMSTDAPIFTIYENNYTNTGTNLNGQFFSSVAGMIDNNDGYSASIDPFIMGPGQHFVAYCTQAQNGGGVGFGEGFYESGCSICAEQTMIVYPSFGGDTGSGNPFVEIGVNNTGSLQADVLLPSTCTTNTNINLSLTHLDDVESLFASL